MNEANVIGLVMFGVMLVMILLGFPVFLSLMAPSFAGLWLIGGANMALMQFTTGIFNQAATYKFAVLPLFMLMGVLAGETGIATGTFDAGRKWLGRTRGGLLMGTIAANLIFGACSGMSTAANAVFGKIAYPELKRNGYDESLSLGCIASVGALSSLIPPSLSIIMFCVLVDLSIGQALLTSIFPGVLTAALYCVMVAVTARVRPGKIPPVTEADRAVTWKDKLLSLRLLIPILLLFGVIIGGSFFGWFSATVAGAIGAFAVILYAIFTKMSPKRLFYNIREAAKMNAQVFPMIIGGMMFSRLITVSGLASAFATIISEMNVHPYIIMLLLVVFYIFMGCIMDIMSIIVITAPIVFPVLAGLGFNEYVVCVILVFLCEIGGLTPPIGMNVFATASVLRLPPAKIFKGVVPFFLVDLAMVMVLIFIPAIATWLPALLA